MNEKLNRLMGALIISLILIGATMATLNQIQAAPRLGPVERPEAAAVQVVNLNSATITSNTTFNGGRWAALGTENPPTKAEIWISVDISATAVNTTDFALQVSPDNSTWLDHATDGTLLQDVAADTDVYYTMTIEGVYYRILATPTNSSNLTPTIKVVLR